MSYHKYKSGDRFGRLTLMYKTHKRTNGGGTIWVCQCDCGKIVERSTGSIRQSLLKGCLVSCGCGRPKDVGEREKDNEERKQKAKLGLGMIEGTTMQGINRKKLNKNNNSGYRGIDYVKAKQKYRARIMFKKKTIYLGEFDTIDEAIKARERAEEIYFEPIREKYAALHGGEK